MLGSFKKELLILVVSFQIFQHLNLDSIWLQRSSTNYMVVEIPLTSSNHSDPTCLKRQPSNICNMQLFWSDGNQSDGDRPARKDILCAMRAITVASITIKQDQTISKKQDWSSWSHSENIIWRPKNHSGNLVWLNFLYDLDVRMMFSCQIGRLSACHGTAAALPELLRAPAPKSQSDPLRHKPHRSCFEVLDDLLQIHLRVWTCLKNFIKKWDTMGYGKLWEDTWYLLSICWYELQTFICLKIEKIEPSSIWYWLGRSCELLRGTTEVSPFQFFQENTINTESNKNWHRIA